MDRRRLLRLAAWVAFLAAGVAAVIYLRGVAYFRLRADLEAVAIKGARLWHDGAWRGLEAAEVRRRTRRAFSHDATLYDEVTVEAIARPDPAISGANLLVVRLSRRFYPLGRPLGWWLRVSAEGAYVQRSAARAAAEMRRLRAVTGAGPGPLESGRDAKPGPSDT